MNDSTALITLEQIGPNPYQVRESEDPAVVVELAANIEKNGLLQPPTVRLVEDRGQRSGGATRSPSGTRAWPRSGC